MRDGVDTRRVFDVRAAVLTTTSLVHSTHTAAAHDSGRLLGNSYRLLCL